MATFGTFASGQVLTAAELNTAGAWESYTPSWTQSVTITKTTNWAQYTKLNKLVIGSVKMTASSAGTANNKILVGLPVAAATNNFIIGQMMYFDDSTNTDLSQTVPCFYETSTTMSFFPYHILSSALQIIGSGAQGATTRFGQDFTTGAGSSVTGVTVATSDVIYIQFMYEAA